MRFIASAVIVILITGCSSPEIVPMGLDTYMIAKDGSFTTFGGGTVKAELYREASAYCKSKGKQLLPINESARDSGYGRYANAELQFRCLQESDSELRRPTMEAIPQIKISVE